MTIKVGTNARATLLSHMNLSEYVRHMWLYFGECSLLRAV